jgi:hypothetical protein
MEPLEELSCDADGVIIPGMSAKNIEEDDLDDEEVNERQFVKGFFAEGSPISELEGEAYTEFIVEEFKKIQLNNMTTDKEKELVNKVIEDELVTLKNKAKEELVDAVPGEFALYSDYSLCESKTITDFLIDLAPEKNDTKSEIEKLKVLADKFNLTESLDKILANDKSYNDLQDQMENNTMLLITNNATEHLTFID